MPMANMAITMVKITIVTSTMPDSPWIRAKLIRGLLLQSFFGFVGFHIAFASRANFYVLFSIIKKEVCAIGADNQILFFLQKRGFAAIIISINDPRANDKGEDEGRKKSDA